MEWRHVSTIHAVLVTNVNIKILYVIPVCLSMDLKQHVNTSVLSCVVEKDLAAEYICLIKMYFFILETCLALLNDKRQCS